MLFQKTKLVPISFCLLLFVSFSIRGQQEGIVKINTSSAIDNVISQKLSYNKSLTSVKGFKIQLFFGTEKNSYKIKEEFEKIFPLYKAQIIFSSPQWKVQVGSYRTRLEADRDLVEIKKEYPGAIIVTTEIDLD